MWTSKYTNEYCIELPAIDTFTSPLSSISTPCSGVTSAQWFIIFTCLSCNALTVCTSSSHVLHNVAAHCWHLLIKIYIVSNTHNILYTILRVIWTQTYTFLPKRIKNNSWFAYLIEQSVGFWHLQHTCTVRGSANLVLITASNKQCRALAQFSVSRCFLFFPNGFVVWFCWNP